MPYQNVPESDWGTMDRCVEHVMGQGHDKEGAIAICHAAIVKGEKDHDALREFVFTDTSKADYPIKTAGDMELDVLGVPFGGPNGGKDSDGEFFSERTKTHSDLYPTPPAVYYHGFDPSGRPMGEPAIIGQVQRIWKDAKGWWYRVALNTSDLAKRIWEAAKRGIARASSGSIAHMVRKTPTGEITNWPVVELSLIDAEGKRQPANQYAVALPAAKAVYQLAGLSLPDIQPEAEAEGAASAADAERDTIIVSNRGERWRLT